MKSPYFDASFDLFCRKGWIENLQVEVLYIIRFLRSDPLIVHCWRNSDIPGLHEVVGTKSSTP